MTTNSKPAAAQASYNTVQLRKVSVCLHTISNQLATVTDQMLPLHVKSLLVYWTVMKCTTAVI